MSFILPSTMAIVSAIGDIGDQMALLAFSTVNVLSYMLDLFS